MIRHCLAAVALACAALVTAPAQAEPLAQTPPMGWNSWDAYGFTIDEADFRANVEVLASMRDAGWTYAVIDEGWYMANPVGANLAERDYLLDANGRLIPVAARFPSAANGATFTPLADWVHAQGLKFGVHILRGIPKQAVENNLPIEGTDFHAADAADQTDLCPWDEGNFGIRDNEAGQAYYDSLMRLYAAWGVDFIKVDCIADHPYKGAEIRQIHDAIAKSGRPMVLSLSPGPTNLSHADEVAALSQMWRISDDIWDAWHFDRGWPKGVDTMFDNLAAWNPHARPGNWPDADMLPFGVLRPHPGWGDPRESRLTLDEARTQFTLAAIARSPLIMGGNLTLLPDDIRTLVTNRDVIAVNQTARLSRPVTDLPAGFENARVWYAEAGSEEAPVRYLALFNTSDAPIELTTTFARLGIPGRHSATELWTGSHITRRARLHVSMPAHGSVIMRLD